MPVTADRVVAAASSKYSASDQLGGGGSHKIDIAPDFANVHLPS